MTFDEACAASKAAWDQGDWLTAAHLLETARYAAIQEGKLTLVPDGPDVRQNGDGTLEIR